MKLLWLTILKFVGLIENQIVPLVLCPELWNIPQSFVRRNTDVKLSWDHLLFKNLFSELESWNQLNCFQMWSPLVELEHPITHGAFWCDHQVGKLLDATLIMKIANEGYGLYCFSKTHVVSENSVHFLVVERSHPLKRVKLVRMQNPFQHVRLF